ncbi:MAG: thioesterase [Tomitella sp.]|nr:thioesterase [Tomitella sp.]
MTERSMDTAISAAPQCFETSYRVRTGDVDQQKALRLDSVARYLQDVAYDNLEAAGFARTDPFWVVRRTVVDVIEPISWPGTVTLQRWCASLSTRWTNMRVRITSEHGTNRLNPHERPAGLIETEAFWINVNERGLPTRISDGGLELLASTTDEYRLRWQAMNPRTPPSADSVGAQRDRMHVLRSTDFDPLEHLNNAAYWAAVEDELVYHPDLTACPHRAVIEYLRPVPPGSEIVVRRRRTQDQLQMLSVDGGVAATVTVSRGD